MVQTNSGRDGDHGGEGGDTLESPSPRRNRVDPWGRLVAHPARGAWMGNRGCLHDAAGRIVAAAVGARWIMCRLRFRNRRRPLLQPGRYTELFFLDEVTALAAGHRPCAECLRSRFELFRQFWVTAGLVPALPTARQMDTALHRARRQDGQRVTYAARLGDLPPGALVQAAGESAPWLVGPGQVWRWDFAGYTPGPGWDAGQGVTVVTPEPVVRLLAAGYPAQVDPSAV